MLVSRSDNSRVTALITSAPLSSLNTDGFGTIDNETHLSEILVADIADEDLDNELETRIWKQFVRRASETATIGKSENSGATTKSRFTSSTNEGNLIINSTAADAFDYYNVSDKGGKKGPNPNHVSKSTVDTGNGQIHT
ncbi:MAG: hypothetical protein ACK521_12150 [bacterium]